jgi:protein-serine/threonine kinase
MTFGGSPWREAKLTDERYRKYNAGWQTWLAKHPEGIINEQSGIPHTIPIISAEFLGNAGIKKLMLKMLHPIPEKRITIREIINHPFFKGIECCTPETCDDGPSPTGDCCTRDFKKSVQRKHSHIPPKDHKTPHFFMHRFDMGDGYR